VKPTDKNAAAAAARANKQKKQLMFLGGLAAVLGVVLFIQFGGSSPSGGPVAQAMEQPAADGSAAAAAPAAQPGSPAGASSVPLLSEAPIDNPVLIKGVEGLGFTRSPFTNFWNVSGKTGTATKGGTPDMAAPAVTLTATMPSTVRPMAVIDGQLHFVGDSIGGWTLTDVQSRSVMLRSPTKALVTIDMPLLTGSTAMPAVTSKHR
jgi:hypothetical protein